MEWGGNIDVLLLHKELHNETPPALLNRPELPFHLEFYYQEFLFLRGFSGFNSKGITLPIPYLAVIKHMEMLKLTIEQGLYFARLSSLCDNEAVKQDFKKLHRES